VNGTEEIDAATQAAELAAFSPTLDLTHREAETPQLPNRHDALLPRPNLSSREKTTHTVDKARLASKLAPESPPLLLVGD
jgi:hypothetical protein